MAITVCKRPVPFCEPGEDLRPTIASHPRASCFWVERKSFRSRCPNSTSRIVQKEESKSPVPEPLPPPPETSPLKPLRASVSSPDDLAPRPSRLSSISSRLQGFAWHGLGFRSQGHQAVSVSECVCVCVFFFLGGGGGGGAHPHDDVKRRSDVMPAFQQSAGSQCALLYTL